MHELYKRYRPKKLEDIVGQPEIVKIIQGWEKTETIPHAVLLVGPSGTGKTTTGRYLSKSLGCNKLNFIEVNCATDRGISMVRDIERNLHKKPIGCPARAYLIDEIHRATGDAQAGFLKNLEDPPKHVYFFLATTNPEKLSRPLRGRCSIMTFKPICHKDLCERIQYVAKKEGISLTKVVVDKIATCSYGSAREALVILDNIRNLKKEKQQLDSIASAGSDPNTVFLGRLLLNEASWADVSAALRDLEDDIEVVRRGVLNYMGSVLLNNKNVKLQKRAARTIETFRDHFYDSGHPGLYQACYEVTVGT